MTTTAEGSVMDMQHASKEMLITLEGIQADPDFAHLKGEHFGDGNLADWRAAISHIGDGSKAEPVGVREEQEAFEKFASGRAMNMEMHPLHYLFLDEQTDAARSGWRAALDFMGYTRPAPTAQDSSAKDNAVQQAQMWAQEARTQRSIVEEIGKLVGCDNDWEMVSAVKAALAAQDSKVPEGTHKVIDYLREGIADATQCESEDMDFEFAYAASAVIDLLSAAPVPAKPQWVSCEERRPTLSDEDAYGCVWAWSPVGGVTRIESGYIAPHNDFTHWMPTGLQRPAAPEGE